MDAMSTETGSRPPLIRAIESARKRLGLTKTHYALRVGISQQALYKILEGGGVNGATLARLRRDGDVRITGAIIDSLDTDAA